jgi:hypothetical protein
MFIRTKKVKGHQYAYLVRNRWTKEGPRQSVSQYLGRVHAPERTGDKPFCEACSNAVDLGTRDLIERLVTWELENHGFREQRGRWVSGDLSVNLSRMEVSGVLRLNSDYLCDYTLRRLLRFKSSRDESEVGLRLAKVFVQAGIPIPEDVFVEVFQKVYKPGQSFVP